MPYFSYKDPSFQFETVERILEEIEDLVSIKNTELDKNFDEWELENKSKKLKNEEYYNAVVDDFVDEKWFITELQANLLNGLAVTINTAYENHNRSIVKALSSQSDSIKYRERPAYKISEMMKFLKIVKHPNVYGIDKDLQKRLRIYTDIRNCLVHSEGRLNKGTLVWSFVVGNKEMFNLKEFLPIVSVKSEYIRTVVKDLRGFFKTILYTAEGEIIY